MKARFFAWIVRHPELIQSPITGLVSFGCVLLGIALVAAPLELLEPTSIGSVLPMWQEIAWALMLCAGGLLTVVGLIVPNRAADCFGTVLIAGTLLIDAVAIWANRGFATGSVTGVLLTTLALGLIARVIVLVWISSILAKAGESRSR